MSAHSKLEATNHRKHSKNKLKLLITHILSEKQEQARPSVTKDHRKRKKKKYSETSISILSNGG